ncbi:Glutamine synthetase 2 cytoplasmic like protein [Argiope bruennichi]|uniref:Glutamine synthetase 2 cytoplasmic like protein n=1 Tax=Argiope bruennichi TaxID=94029 RepID=A0A8T0EHH6_ARGBR|nr:Glutamine synthetase 2 cytoplasmic like protein [Argiope bruennichi]
MDPQMDHKLLTQNFLKLEQPANKVQCMHVYVDGSLRNFRAKDQTWPQKPQHPDEFPLLEFCGSATDFDVGNVADYYAKPVKLYKDPFRREPNTLVFCETYSREGLPTFANNRYRLLKVVNSQLETAASFTFYQSYTFLRKEDGKPLSYMDPAYDPDSKSGFACGRIIAESHYKACLYAGVNMASLEPINRLGQWATRGGPSLRGYSDECG